MGHNLSIKDVYLRYVLMAFFVILGGVLHMIPVMLLGMPIFVTAILGWCPIYQAMGINHHNAPR